MELAAYLIDAAPKSAWTHPGKRPVELFESREHDVLELLSRYEAHWRWLLGGTKRPRPVELRSEFSSRLIGSVPVLSATNEQWELRCSRIQALPVRVVFFYETGWPSEQPAFAPPAPGSRFIDTAADIQIDPATLPANQALMAAPDDREELNKPAAE